MNYQLELEKIIQNKENHGKTLLIHSCCGPCSSYVLEYLGEYFKIIIFYYNPNIHPYEELELRVQEQKKVIDFLETKYPIELMVEEGDPKDFYNIVKDYKDLEEGSLRCYECYKLRLKRAAKIAYEMNCDYYTTTLSISPYKNVEWLNDLVEELKLGDVKALPADFKKKAGFQRSIELSNDMNLYRQDYCGCVYSMIEKEERDQKRKNENSNKVF